MKLESKREEEHQDTLLRRCVISRNRRPKELLLRFVVDLQGQLIEDLTGKLPGRGFYVIAEQKHVTALLARHKIINEAAEAMITRVKNSLERRLLDGVGLARRAGSCEVGVRKVEELLKHGRRPLIILAADAGSVRDKLNQLMQDYDPLEIVEVLDREQLGTVWGDKLVAIAAVINVGVAARIRIDATRWRTFTQVSEDKKRFSK